MAHIDPGSDKRSVDVNLNIVPFIDLMSCLTAFLLVTAVWTNMAQIPVQPKGVARDGALPPDDEAVRCSVLLQDDTIWVGVSRVNDFRKIPRDGAEYDWRAFGDVLAEIRDMRALDLDLPMELAADDAVAYQSIINAMDTALAAGFPGVGIAEPAALSARPMM